jgi:cytochrome c551/c552
MKFKTITTAIIIYSTLFLAVSCGNEGVKTDATDPAATAPQELASNQPETHGVEIKEGDITISSPLQKDLVSSGKHIYELKCQACHKLTDEKLVGPGWKDITKKRKPVWIMNMITNTEAMLASDPEAQKLLEQCLVRMPNQNISKDEARQILEFMRENDGEK